jgi:hypothetical protein
MFVKFWHLESTSDSNMLTLTDAIKSGKIKEFVAQEEARGIGPADSEEVASAIKRLATRPLKSKDRTSRLPSADGSSGK